MSKKRYLSKRVKIIYVVIFLWLLLGSLAAYFNIDWAEVSWYFASLTTYVGTYITSETLKKSSDPTTKFLPKSTRERITYICMFIWFITGVYGIWSGTNLEKLALYFTSLSSFIILYVLGQHLRSNSQSSATLPIIPKDMQQLPSENENEDE